jgi:lipopolysaccharide transport system ATP-binding protein
VIALDYEAEDGQPLPNCRASVAFYDGLGPDPLQLLERAGATRPARSSSTGNAAAACIPALPLSQNQYVLTLFLEVNRQVEDWILNGIELDVVDGDFYGTWKTLSRWLARQGVLVPHDWSIPSGDDR